MYSVRAIYFGGEPMTPLPISAEQMLEIARRVYPKFTPMITNRWGKDEVCLYWDDGGFHTEFKPELDGDSDGKAQALDCIVAADKIDSGFSSRFHRDECGFLDERMDLLQAALSTLAEAR